MTKYIIAIPALLSAVFAAGCSNTAYVPPDYTEPANWAYAEADETAKADVFFVCPTVYGGDGTEPNMPLDDTETKEAFLGATNMEKGIYDGDTRFFAPYYRQAGLYVYTLPEDERTEYLDAAYKDVSAAFETYLDEYGGDKPLILAGFSQGADMCLRLMKDHFDDEELLGRLVACYAIGWQLTEEETAEYPQLKMASGEDDTGGIILFNTEDASVTGSLTVPEGETSLCINPLNWRTDPQPAGKDQNDGACFTDYSGAVTKEIPALTGAYIDPGRGTLKVTDIDPAEYPPSLDLFGEGVYHLYDYQFFYRDLQDNVQTRIDAYNAKEQ